MERALLVNDNHMFNIGFSEIIRNEEVGLIKKDFGLFFYLQIVTHFLNLNPKNQPMRKNSFKLFKIKPHGLMFACVYLLSCLDVSARYSDYYIKQYNSNNGLPQNSITGMSFDKNGLLWLATQGGICNFDGQNFTSYNQFNTPVFKSSRFCGFYTGENGDLVAVDADWNLYHISKNNIQKKDTPSINNLKATEAKGLIVNGSVMFFDRLRENKNWKGFGGVTVVVNSHEAYMQTGKVIYFLDNVKNTVLDIMISSWKSAAFEPAFTAGDFLIFCKKKGPKVYCHGKRRYGIKFTNTAKDVVKNFSRYKGKRLCQPLVLAGHDIYKISCHGNTIDALLLADNITIDPLYDIACSLYDSSKNTICLGTNTNGLYFLIKKKISFVPTGVMDEVTSLQHDFFLGDGIKFNIYSKRWAKIKEPVEHVSLFKSSGGWVWGKVNGMLAKARPGSTDFTPVQELKDLACTFNDDQFSLICSDNYIWKMGTNGKFNKLVELFIHPSYMFRYDKDKIWLVDHQDVFEYDITQNKINPKPLFSANANIRFIFRASDRTIWLTTYGMGIYALVHKKLFALPADHSACLRYAHNIYEDKKGYFWIPTNNGLIQCRRDELELYIRDSTTYPFFYRYGLSDGLVTNEFNGAGACPYDSSERGELVYPSMKGAIFFSPSVLVPDIGKDNFIIESVHINDNPINETNGKDVEITPDFDKIKVKIIYPYYGDFNNVDL